MKKAAPRRRPALGRNAATRPPHLSGTVGLPAAPGSVDAGRGAAAGRRRCTRRFVAAPPGGSSPETFIRRADRAVCQRIAGPPAGPIRSEVRALRRSLVRAVAPALVAAAAALAAFPTGALAQGEVRGVHGDWQIRCDTLPGAQEEQCALLQNVTAADRENVGLTVIVLKTADQSARILRVLAPLGVLLPSGLGLRVLDDADVTLPVAIDRSGDGPIARATLPDGLVLQPGDILGTADPARTLEVLAVRDKTATLRWSGDDAKEIKVTSLDHNIGRAGFVRCLPNGCIAEVVLEDVLIGQLRNGSTATFIIFQTPEEGIGIPISLTGFGEGFDALP
jgi:invasion protein IalB